MLQRIRATASQQGLSGAERERNITSRAFRIHPRHRDRLRDRRVLLIDDVLTTGSTVTACTQISKRGGAAAVDVLALARVVSDAGDIISSSAADLLERADHRPRLDPENRKRNGFNAQD